MPQVRSTLLIAAATILSGCGEPDVHDYTVAFELDGPLAGETFFDLPFPSDLRMTADGHLDVAGFPNPRDLPVINDLLGAAARHRGATMAPIAYFRFTEQPPEYAATDLIPAAVESPVWLLDIDPDSPARGSLHATVAVTMPADDFAPASLVAVAARPGVVLLPNTTYAMVLTREFATEAKPPAAFATLASGGTPAGARGAAAAAAFAPLWDTLPMIGRDPDDVLVATVFTTGDVVAELHERSELVRAAYDATITGVQAEAVSGGDRDGYCELTATLTIPIFQRGTAPYNRDGDFEYEADGTPVVQRMLDVPLTITLPDGPMPVDGWPLTQYFHGSGGTSDQVANAGPTPSVGAEPTPSLGPSHTLARIGVAAAGAALPVNPQRVPGASDIEYINVSNLAAFPFTFQEGVLEQRLMLDAMLALEIDASVAPTCADLAAGTHRFDASKLVGMGQSMGGMYTNLIGAVEPRFGALVPTGAGGFWNTMILITEVLDDPKGLLSALFGAPLEHLHFAYPPLALLEMGWEIAEPGVFAPRLARRPLPGLPVRQLYVPVGQDDRYFPEPVLDAMALAYGNQQAGDVVWPEMQQAMAIEGFDGLASYPVANNRTGGDGTAYTGVVVQYPEDGIIDGHQVYRQYEEVKHQYSCFLTSYFDTGVATVPAPASLDTPCP
ncbi:MAG: hypothetical protein R2939_09675 [Kofleriaceae bacterium]